MIRLKVIAPPHFAAARIVPATETSDPEVVLVHPRFGDKVREVAASAPSLRWVHSLGAGVETLPLDALRDTDIVVTNSRGVYSAALAEWALAAMLYFAKDLRRLVMTKSWQPFDVQRLEGATLGVIGHGSIGSSVANLAAAFGMKILTSRRRGGTPIDDLVAASDYIVLSTPLTPETRGLFNRDRIARMRTNAVLINVARGAIVDEPALIDALGANRIRGAALDVFQVEPLPEASPLWHLENVLLSPHSADHTTDAHDRAVAMFLENLERYKRGEPLENVVDKSAGY